MVFSKLLLFLHLAKFVPEKSQLLTESSFKMVEVLLKGFIKRNQPKHSLNHFDFKEYHTHRQEKNLNAYFLFFLDGG